MCIASVYLEYWWFVEMFTHGIRRIDATVTRPVQGYKFPSEAQVTKHSAVGTMVQHRMTDLPYQRKANSWPLKCKCTHISQCKILWSIKSTIPPVVNPNPFISPSSYPYLPPLTMTLKNVCMSIKLEVEIKPSLAYPYIVHTQLQPHTQAVWLWCQCASGFLCWIVGHFAAISLWYITCCPSLNVDLLSIHKLEKYVWEFRGAARLGGSSGNWLTCQRRILAYRQPFVSLHQQAFNEHWWLKVNVFGQTATTGTKTACYTAAMETHSAAETRYFSSRASWTTMRL